MRSLALNSVPWGWVSGISGGAQHLAPPYHPAPFFHAVEFTMGGSDFAVRFECAARRSPTIIDAIKDHQVRTARHFHGWGQAVRQGEYRPAVGEERFIGGS